MQLMSILVSIVATLTLLTGVSVLFGSKSKERLLSILFSVAVAGASCWAYAVVAFLNLTETARSIAPMIVAIVYISAPVMSVAIFGFAAKYTKVRFGYWLSAIFAVIGLTLAVLIGINPQFLYSEIILSSDFGNEVGLRFDWFYFSYVAFFVVTITAYGLLLLAKLISRPPILVRNTLLMLLVGPGICAVVSFCFGLIAPLTRYDLIWVGPLTIDIAIIAYYYAILRYRMIMVRAGWLRMLSYVVLIATMALVYVILVFIASIFLFRVSHVPTETLVLNFLMIAAVLVMIPALAGMMSGVRSLLSINTIDIGYVAKRLNRFNQPEVDFGELASFLADHLHFSYVGLIVDGKLFGSKEVDFSVKEVEIGAIESKSAPDRMKQALTNTDGSRLPKFADLRAIMDLRDTDGKPFGRIVLGTPIREDRLSEKDFLQLEMIVGLIATTVDPERRKQAA